MTIPHAKRVRSPGAMVAALRADPHAPYAAMIEVADRCNEACIHCYQVHGSRREMSTEQIEQVMDQLAALGVLFLTISGGEPTLRPDFLQLVEHARSLRFAVKIFSNGLRIDAEMARALSELAVQSVELSLYSHRPEVHDRITRVPGSFERTVSAARWLIAEGVHVVLKAPLMKPNASDYEAYIDWVEALGADYVLDPHLDPREDGSLEPTALRVDDRSYVRLRSDARLVEPSEPTPAPRAPELERSVCGACSGFVHVEADGELRPCTQLQIPVGHALREGIQKAHESN
ncbi:MAG: radical SAM protein, partial [Myxococcales bacterium]|nr:radical SAM protein [Myxococcales bacterium]